MNKQFASLATIIVVAVVLLLVIRGCQQTKEVEVKQKSNDKKTEISIEIEKIAEKKQD